MSGWDATSRPTWDPQDGPEENTQSFGVPDSWYSPQEPAREPASPGPGNGTQGNGRQGNGRQGNGRHAGGPRAESPRGNQEWDRAPQANPGRQADPGRQHYPDRQDYPDRSSRASARPPRDHRADPLGRGHAEFAASQDPEQAARMDPALRDFFAPQPERRGPGQGQGQAQRQNPGQRPGSGLTQPAGRSAGHSRDQWGPAQDTRDPRRDQAGQGRGPRQPGGPFEDARPGDWDSQAPRQGSRSARHQEATAEGSGRTALIAVAVVVVVGIAVGAYLLVHRGHSSPPSAGPTTHPTSSPTATKSTAPVPPKTVAYTLTTPATAGGYPKLTTTPSAVQAAAGAVSQAIENAVKQDGAKVTGQVTAGYQLSSGQVLAFTGFKGRFTPAKVIASLATLGTHSQPGTAGPHGGMLACATAPGSPSGTVCVWVTTTTLGVTEFFSSTGPEVVTDQAKAASDTLKFRNSVEVAKS
jgi:hypothetical protein